VACQCCYCAPGWCHFCPARLPPEWHHFLLTLVVTTNLSLSNIDYILVIKIIEFLFEFLIENQTFTYWHLCYCTTWWWWWWGWWWSETRSSDPSASSMELDWLEGNDDPIPTTIELVITFTVSSCGFWRLSPTIPGLHGQTLANRTKTGLSFQL